MAKPAAFLEALQPRQARFGPAEPRDGKIRKRRILLNPAERTRAVLYARRLVADASIVPV